MVRAATGSGGVAWADRSRRRKLSNMTPTATSLPGAEVPRSAPRSPAAALGIVWLVVFIDLLGFGIVLPVMPRHAGPYLDHLGLSGPAKGVVIGLLFSVFSLMQFVFSPVWGRVSDRIGRKPVLLLSLGGSVAFYALYGVAVALPPAAAAWAVALLLLSRVGAGIAGASVGTAAAVIADCTPPERRAKGMALIGIAFGAGFTFGPLIAYFGLSLFDQKPWGVGALATALCLGAFVLAVILFRETRDPANRAGKDFFSVRKTVEVLRTPVIGTLVLVYFLAIFAFAQYEATLALLTEAAFGMTVEDNFLVFALIGAVLTVAGGVYRPLARQQNERRLMTAGLLLMIVGLLGVAGVAYQAAAGLMTARIGPDGLRFGFYLTMALAVVGFAFVNPSVSALVSKNADPARQGEVLGVNQAFAALGRILGPLLGSVLFQAGGSHTLPYLAATGLLLVVLTLLPRTGRPA